MKVKDLFDKRPSVDDILKIKDRDKLEQYLFDIAPYTATSTGLKTWVTVCVLFDKFPVLQVSNTPGPFNWNSYFLVAISDNPKILTPKAVRLSYKDVLLCFQWIKLNVDKLIDIAKTHDWIDAKPIKLTEDKILLEMAGIKPENSGFPYPMRVIYTGQRHAFRVKVSKKINGWLKGDNNSFSILVSNDPQVVAGTPEIDNEMLNQMFEWIVNNLGIFNRIEQVFNTGNGNMDALINELTPYGQEEEDQEDQ